jgi:hypothetical protein
LHKHNNTTLQRPENTVQIKNQTQITKASSNRGNNKQNKEPTNTTLNTKEIKQSKFQKQYYFETNFEINLTFTSHLILERRVSSEIVNTSCKAKLQSCHTQALPSHMLFTPPRNILPNHWRICYTTLSH